LSVFACAAIAINKKVRVVIKVSSRGFFAVLMSNLAASLIALTWASLMDLVLKE